MARSPISSAVQNMRPFGLQGGRFGESSNQAIGQIGTALANQGGQFADSLANAFQGYTGGAANMFGTYGNTNASAMNNMSQMFGDYSRAFTGYGNTIGNIAGNAAANRAAENAGRYAAWAGMGQGFNDMLGNLGSSALAAYGGTANAALQAQAMRESAALKAMADMVAANQAAASSYGGQQAAALAGLANAYANAGGALANSRGNISQAASTLGVGGSNAFANLGSNIANAAANASTGQNQGMAALLGAISNALSGLGVGEQNAIANATASGNEALAGIANANSNAVGALGNASANLGSNLGNAASQVAGNSLNFTRDMGKLGLAELLGIGQLNVASQGAATTPYIGGAGGGGFGPGSLTISGPDGVIASGGATGGLVYGGPAAGTGGSPPSPITFNPSASWYRNPQYGDGGGMSAINNIADRGYGAIGSGLTDNRNTVNTAMGGTQNNVANATNAIRQSGADSRNQIASQSGAGADDIRNAYNRAMGVVEDQGRQSQAGIGSALLAGYDEIGKQGTAIDADAANMFRGIDASGQTIADRGILDSLNANYGSGMRTLTDAYYTGRQDPRTILQDVFAGVQNLQNPILGLANQRFGDMISGFPQPIDPASGPGFMDPTPYLSALQAGWAPFLGGLDRAYSQGNANVLGALAGFNNEYRTQAGGLRDQYQSAAGGINNLYNQHMDEVGGMFDPTKVAAQQIAADRLMYDYGLEKAGRLGDRAAKGYMRRNNLG